MHGSNVEIGEFDECGIVPANAYDPYFLVAFFFGTSYLFL